MQKYIKKNSQKTFSPAIERVNYNVAGIDIGSSSMFVCIGSASSKREVREFSAFTADMHAMVSWLKENNVKSAAIESTGVYWIPVYDILEEEKIKVLLANPYYAKSVPGRKTDVQDCQWLQELHAHGLLRGSFRPDPEGVILRTYVRQRTKNVELAAMQISLMHKALTQMNVQLNLVLSDIVGLTGLQIIKSIIQGERNPRSLAKLRNYNCKKSEEEIAKALEGNFKSELVFALQQAVEAYEFFRTQADKCEEHIKIVLEKQQKYDLEQNENDNKLTDSTIKGLRKIKKNIGKKSAHNPGPYGFDAATTFERILGVNLQEIPGFEGNSMVKILSETGIDMSRWLTAKHFTSWLGLSPNNKISGGRILSSRTNKSSNKAAQALRIIAQTLYRSNSALGAYFRRMRARLGGPKAITATAHKLAKIMYYMIKNRVSFKELGQEAYEKLHQERNIKNLQKRAKEAGFTLTPLIS